MKRNLKIAASSVLTAAMVLSMTACDQSSGGNIDITTNADFEPLQEYINTVKSDYVNSLAGTSNADMTVDKKIKVLNWWVIDETQASVELFKQVYGIPEEGSSAYGETFANKVFVTDNVAYGDRYTRLASLVTSGDSPDMFQFEIINFPYSAAMGLFQPIDDYIDFSNPLWDSSRDIMKKFQWNEKNYVPITGLEAESILWYRRSVCEQAGIKDPYEYFQEGNWNWDTFIDVCEQFSDPEGGKYVVDGYHVADNLILTTGVPLVEIKDGQLSNNFYNADIERAMSNLIEVMNKQNYRKPHNNDVGWGTDMSSWARGNTLFFEGLENDIKDSFQAYFTRMKWEDNDLWFVPYPKDPNSGDNYYQSMKVGNFMLCGGAKNPTGYAAWQLCGKFTANDTDGEMIGREQLKTNYVGYTDEWFDWLNHYKKDGLFTPVFEFKAGLGQDFVDDNIDNPINSLLQKPYYDLPDEDGNAVTFSTLRQSNEGAVNDRISALNNGTL